MKPKNSPQNPSVAPVRRQRNELPVSRGATGRSLPTLTNADIHRILEEEETAQLCPVVLQGAQGLFVAGPRSCPEPL